LILKILEFENGCNKRLKIKLPFSGLVLWGFAGLIVSKPVGY
tara:strand:+ start:959 stop:1084 length:126 start_codon:yes stop_codon:yes gene_type:complete